MAYELVASAGNFALVNHPDGGTYRYNMAWGGDGGSGNIIAYQLADHAAAYAPGVSGRWTYHHGVTFDSIDQFRLWWTYDRITPTGG